MQARVTGDVREVDLLGAREGRGPEEIGEVGEVFDERLLLYLLLDVGVDEGVELLEGIGAVPHPGRAAVEEIALEFSNARSREHEAEPGRLDEVVDLIEEGIFYTRR
jgi:hypothetical protein